MARSMPQADRVPRAILLALPPARQPSSRRYFAPCSDRCDDVFMTERRKRRADTITLALSYQLDVCCRDGAIDAMVLADEDGLPLAAAGDVYACDEVAARMVQVGRRVRSFDGTLLDRGRRWEIQMTKVSIDGSQLLVCAVGGTPDQRKRQIARGAAGALRILAN
jgi:hypothetical protein